MSKTKPNVVFEQYVIPPYRVAFFKGLAEYVNLIVVGSKKRTVDGVLDIKKKLPFKSVRLSEEKDSSTFHPRILDLLREYKADVYITGSPVLTKILSDKELYSKLKSCNVKTIWMGCDGYWVRNFPLAIFHRFRPRRLPGTIKDIIAVSRVDGFVAHSTHMYKYLNLVRFVPKWKITLTHNAIDTSILTKLYYKWSKAGKKREKNKIIFVGRLSSEKKVDVLVDAFAKISSKWLDTQLTIIGEGSQERYLQQKTHRLGLNKRIHFKGGIYDENLLARYLYQSSLFVLPGLGGLGLNTAMAMGLPVICTHADGTEKDLVLENYNGWHFDGTVNHLSRLMEKALSDPVKLQMMGERSVKLIKNKFNIDNMIKDYLHRINYVLNKK